MWGNNRKIQQLERALRRQGEDLGKRIDALRAEAEHIKQTCGGPDDGRIGALERRQAQLEQDALVYLRRGSTRLARAEKLEARVNEEAEDEPLLRESPAAQQISLFGPGGQKETAAGEEELSVEQVREIMRRSHG